MTAGQLASYDQIKELLLSTKYFKDNIICHFTCSSIAGFIATVICSPIDVIKTRLMNMKGAKYKGISDCFIQTLKSEGVFAFFKGFGPSLTRLVPQTILTFIFYEKFNSLLNKIKNN